MTELHHFENSEDVYTTDKSHPNWNRWTESEKSS